MCLAEVTTVKTAKAFDQTNLLTIKVPTDAAIKVRFFRTNPMLATLAYYRKARELGVRFMTGKEVAEIKKIKGKARQVVTTEDAYEGDTIILAAGYDSRFPWFFCLRRHLRFGGCQ